MSREKTRLFELLRAGDGCLALGVPSGNAPFFDIPRLFWYVVMLMKKGVDYIGVGVGAVIADREGRFFLARRGRDARNETGKWEFPGGSVEFGEKLEDALVREVQEEYGFEVVVERLLDVMNHIIPAENQHWVSPTFLCTYKSGAPRILEPHKCEEIGWFALVNIPEKELTIASKKSLASLKKFLSKP
jgi:mutator protein MutT